MSRQTSSTILASADTQETSHLLGRLKALFEAPEGTVTLKGLTNIAAVVAVTAIGTMPTLVSPIRAGSPGSGGRRFGGWLRFEAERQLHVRLADLEHRGDDRRVVPVFREDLDRVCILAFEHLLFGRFQQFMAPNFYGSEFLWHHGPP